MCITENSGVTHEYRIVEECEYGKSNKAILEDIVPVYIWLKISTHSKFNVHKSNIQKQQIACLHFS
jgi:hypothetical protein